MYSIFVAFQFSLLFETLMISFFEILCFQLFIFIKNNWEALF